MSILPAALASSAYLSGLASNRGANAPRSSASSAAREAMPSSSVEISAAARELAARDATPGGNPPQADTAAAVKDSLIHTQLALPSMERVEALKRHIDGQLPAFLAAHGIAYAPSSIRYDGEGQMGLPADYPYAGQLKEALKTDPDMAADLASFNNYLNTLADLARGTSFDTGEPVVLRFSPVGTLIRGREGQSAT